MASAKGIVIPTTLAGSLNLGLFSSASAIVGAFRLKMLGEASAAVPPDVAAVTTELRSRTLSAFNSVIGEIQPLESGMNDEYRRTRRSDMPELGEAQSVLDPVYYQYNLLKNAPVIEDAWVWRDMPQELYLANQYSSSSPEVQTALQDLGFVAAAQLGGDAYNADESKVEIAKQSLATLAEVQPFGVKIAPVVAEWVVPIISNVSRLLVVAAGGAVVYSWISQRAALAETASRVADNASRQRQAAIMAQTDSMLFNYCMRRVASTGGLESECLQYRNRMQQWPQPVTPEGLPGDTGCSWKSCWAWATGGGMLGLLLGHTIAKRLGLGSSL